MPAHRVAVTLLTAALALAGCIEKRPRRDRDDAASTQVATAIVDPAAVDGAFDHLVQGERFAVPITADDPAQGAALPLVTIVEFSDFECPFCGRLAANLAALAQRYPDDVRLVFKQFPLPMHQRAEPAARATIAAHAQGKFWEMHDALFTNRNKLGDRDLEAHARQGGLDVEKWTADFAAQGTLDRVRADAAIGRAAKVESTPTFFLNGRKVTGAKDVEELARLVEEERAAANRLIEAGAKRSEIYARFMHAVAPAAEKEKPVAPTDVEKPAVPEQRRGEASTTTNYAIGPGSGRATQGPADALVTVVAFTDYGCKDCKQAHATFAAVTEKHPEVRFALRFLPQSPAAASAAKVAIAAGQQGKLWETHRSLVALDTALDGAPMRKLVQAHEIDMTKFDADLASPLPAAMLTEDAGVVEIVRGSAVPPFYFVNGRILPHDATTEQFDALIAEESKKADLFIQGEGLTRATGFEGMRQTWRGAKLIDAIAKAVPDVPTTDGGAAAKAPLRGDPSKAKVTIVACTDFDCPACARGAKTLGELGETYGDAIAIEYHHLVPPGRTAGELAHFAAMAAGEQGKFWEMHDALYRSRAARSDAALEKLATTIGLDVAKWNTDRKDDRLRARLESDAKVCESLGLTALPAWKIGDELVLGAQPKARFVQAIDAALTK
jgi:protein-disulfide isomerase